MPPPSGLWGPLYGWAGIWVFSQPEPKKTFNSLSKALYWGCRNSSLGEDA